MTNEELNTEIQSLLSERVSFKRNAANSLIIYFRGEPGDPEVISFFIDPTWRFEKQNRIEVGSYDFQIEESDFSSEAEYTSTWEQRCALMDSLTDSALLRAEVDARSGDLLLEFSGEQVVRSFANSAFHENSWTYRNTSKKMKALVSARGIRVEILQEQLPHEDGDT